MPEEMHFFLDQRKKLFEILKPNPNFGLIASEKYFICATDWVIRFKRYIDFDNTSADSGAQSLANENDALHPGPIDNSSLLDEGDPSNELLRKGLLEGQDYQIVPKAEYEYLRGIYGGELHFCREAIRIYERTGGYTKVDLWPFKISVYTCDGNSAKVSDSPNEKTEWVESVGTITDLNALFPTQSDLRLWLRVNKPALSSSLFGENHRDITRDFMNITTDESNSATTYWRVISEAVEDRISELVCAYLGEGTRQIDILVEEPKNNGYQVTTRGAEYPRDELLESWKSRLEVGDILDFREHKHTSEWHNGVVVQTFDKELVIRRLGFQDDNKNRKTIKLDTDPCLYPLFVKTYDWRELIAIDDFVELNTMLDSDGDPVWKRAKVRSVDKHARTLELAVPGNINNSTTREVALYSESICQENTHIRQTRAATSTALTTTDTGISNVNRNATSYNRGYGGYSGYSYGYERRHTPGRPFSVAGTVGLVNLGNTCFMASMLQCLSNTKEFSDFFLSDEYKTHLNRDSIHSHKGRIAEEYAALIKDLWGGRYSSCAPVDFKRTIGEFASQFAGYQQQDSQEFLLFFLDGLHEDLNRIVKKPYIESKDSDGRSDEEVAAEAWTCSKMREDSVVVDKFHGQLKSHVTCLNCGHESTTFDSYGTLSVPIPVKTTKTVEALLYPLPYGSRPRVVSFEMPTTALVSTFQEALVASSSSSTGAHYQFAVVSSYSKGRIDKNLQESSLLLDSLRHYGALAVFEVPEDTEPANIPYYMRSKVSSVEDDGRTYTFTGVDVIMTEPTTPSYSYSYASTYPASPSCFGNATRLCVPRGASNRMIHAALAPHAAQFIKASLPGDAEPYKLKVSNAYGSVTVREIPCDDDVFRITENQCIAVSWTKEARSSMYFDDNQLTPLPLEASRASGEETTGNLTLYQCLDKFAEKEKLADTETVYCRNCKEHRAPEKKMDLWSTPDILIVHLKRFQYIPGQYFTHREKITDEVHFPVEGLDLTPYIRGTIDPSRLPLYDLFGVSQHMGGLNGGHYTAICQNAIDKEWYNFNDSSVSRASASEIVSAEAYVLFYRRRGSCPVAGVASLSPLAARRHEEEGSGDTTEDYVMVPKKGSDYEFYS